MGRDNYNQGRNQGNRRDDRPQFDTGTFKKTWISGTFERETVDFANKLGKYLVDNRLTTSQIRNVYGEVKRIQAKKLVSNEGAINEQSKKDFLLLQPKIAYASKRAGTRGIETLQDVLNKAHNAVNLGADAKTVKQQFQNFCDFFEAILAYHKAYGGRE